MNVKTKLYCQQDMYNYRAKGHVAAQKKLNEKCGLKVRL
jgi:hypothetical protein